MQKRSYTFKNEKNELICVFRLDTFSVGTKTYSVGFFESRSAKFIGRTKRCFDTAEEAQCFLDRMAHLNHWLACEM
jgi:hypothetical protein